MVAGLCNAMIGNKLITKQTPPEGIPVSQVIICDGSSVRTLYKVVETTGWFFLTGPPLKMSLDWPPQKMPRLAPPCFGKVLSMAAEKGEIQNTLTFSIPVGGQSGTLMFS